jgi:hypothetical protein
MSILRRIISGLQWTKCSIKVSNAFKKEGIIDQNENKKNIDFFSDIEFLRHQWTKILGLKSDKEKLAIFSIIYYLLEIQFDGNPYYWAKNQVEMDYENEIQYWGRVTSNLEKPIMIYKNFIVEDYIGKTNFNAESIFKEHLDHLHKINFFDLLMFKGDYFEEELNKNVVKSRIDLISRYLLVFFHSELFYEIDIIKDKNGSIDTDKLLDKIDSIIIMSPNLGFQFDKVQAKLYALSNFTTYSLLKSFNKDNEVSSISKYFNYLKI